MKRATFKVMFYVKRLKIDDHSEVPIYMRVTVNGTRAEIAIQRMIQAEDWVQERGQSKSRSKEAIQLNDYLQQCKSRVYEVQKEIEHIGREVTAASIKARYNGADPDKKFLLQEFDTFINKKGELVGREITKATVQKFRMCFSHLKEYLKREYKEKDIPMSGLTYEVVMGFDHFLRTVKNQQPNTTIKTMQTLKGFIRFAENNEWINRNPFGKIKMCLKPVDRGYLTVEELNLITDHSFKVERVQQVADVFVFCCYTGLAYSDVKELNPGHLIKMADGSLQVSKKRKKTGRQLSIPLLKPAQSLVEKYQKHPCRKLNRIFPVLSNQKMNAYLKEVGDLCGISKGLTTHLARHTFATTVTMANGMPIEVVSQLLGHSSIPMTQHYARMITSRLTGEMKKLDLVLEGTNKVDTDPMKALLNFNLN